MRPGAAILSEALETRNRVDSLRSLVIRRLVQDGLSRETVIGDLEDLRRALENDERFEEEEIVMTVMDHMLGWCTPSLSLVRIGASEFDRPLLGPRDYLRRRGERAVA
jgi:hypothetical protein